MVNRPGWAVCATNLIGMGQEGRGVRAINFER